MASDGVSAVEVGIVSVGVVLEALVYSAKLKISRVAENRANLAFVPTNAIFSLSLKRTCNSQVPKYYSDF